MFQKAQSGFAEKKFGLHQLNYRQSHLDLLLLGEVSVGLLKTSVHYPPLLSPLLGELQSRKLK